MAEFLHLFEPSEETKKKYPEPSEKELKKILEQPEEGIDYLELEKQQERKELRKKILKKIKKHPSKKEKKEEKKDIEGDVVMNRVENIKKSASELIKELIEKMGCSDLLKNLSNVKVLTNKASASVSIIVFGDMIFTQKIEQKRETKTLKVALKTVFKPFNALNNSLLVEEQIYKNVISNLLNLNRTPHLVRYIGSYTNCSLNLDHLNSVARLEFKSELEKIRATNQYDISKATVIVLAKSSGRTLADYFNTLNDDDKLIIVFQLLYTILCFKNMSLKHNDLHFGNIFVEEFKHPRPFYYKLNGYMFSIKTRYSINIYDFDRGSVYHPSVERNMELDVEYYRYNELNELNDKMDFQAVLSSLVRLKMPIIFTEWIHQIVSDSFYSELLTRPYPQVLRGNPDILAEDKDLTPLDASFIKYIRAIEKQSFFSKFYQEDKNIYSPPKHFTLSYDIVESRTNHESYGKIKSRAIVGKINDDAYKNTLIRVLKISNKRLLELYAHEYDKLKYNIFKNTILLFKSFYVKKPIDNYILEYMRVCLVLSLPFWHKFQNYTIKEKFFIYLFNVPDYSEYKLIEDDIWNIFQNILPIKQPSLIY